MPSLKAQSGAFIPTAWMPYFTFTRLNQYLDLLPVIGYEHIIALWKAYNKSKQIAQFKKNCTDFAQTLLKVIGTF